MTERRLFNDDDITDPLRTEADDDFIVQDGSYGDVAFPAMAVAAEGFLLDSGNGGVTFPYSESGDGFLLATGTGAVAFGFAIAGTGTVDAGVVVDFTPYLGHRYQQAQPLVAPAAISGSAAISFGWSLAGIGHVNDDELVLELLLGVAA